MKPNVYVSKEVAEVSELYIGLVGEPAYTLAIGDQIKGLAARLKEGHERKHPGAYFELSNWHPTLNGKPEETIWGAKLEPKDYLDTVSREMGYKHWLDVVDDLSAKPDAEFETFVDAALTGETDKIEALLSKSPDLVNRTSHWKHKSTALHYMAANGVETYRQIVANNAPQILKTLISNGAEVNAEAKIYDGKQKVLGLLLSSSHPAEAGVTKEMKDVLINAGAV